MPGRQIRFAVAAFGIAAMFVAPAQAQDRSAQFAAEALRICIDTRAAAPALRQLAAAEGWTATDAAALPGESSITVGGKPNVTHYPSNIWTVDKGGLALTILVYDIPKVKHCEVLAWDLDEAGVDLALKSDSRVKGGFYERPGMPMRRYEIRKPSTIFRYGAGKIETRSLHILTAH
jgi:hypothetical protein